jgi:hypothetical protein
MLHKRNNGTARRLIKIRPCAALAYPLNRWMEFALAALKSVQATQNPVAAHRSHRWAMASISWTSGTLVRSGALGLLLAACAMARPRPSWPASDLGVHVRSASDRRSERPLLYQAIGRPEPWRMRPSRPAHVPPASFPFFSLLLFPFSSLSRWSY